jgi:predicted N-acyltransferase
VTKDVLLRFSATGHPGLRAAVNRFLGEERAAVRSYMAELARFTPCKRSGGAGAVGLDRG